MTTENNETAAQTENLNAKSQRRIAYEQNQLAEKTARLATLTPGTKAYVRCEASIETTRSFIVELEGKLAARLERQAAPKPSNKRVSFNVEVEPSNESDPEHLGAVAV